LIWVDYCILGIIGLSAGVSIVRGFAREAISLAGWVVAVWLAVTQLERVSAYLVAYIELPSLRLTVAFVAVFMGVLIVTGFMVFLIGLMVEKTAMSGTDRVLGVVFGIARGVAIVAVLVALAGLTPLPQDPWWGQSVVLPQFERLALEIRGALPDEIAGDMQF
jgi:membrane protein required for colicin V production